MTMNENKDVNIDEGKGHVSTTYLIHEGLKYVTSLEQYFLAHDPNIDPVLQCQRKL